MSDIRRKFVPNNETLIYIQKYVDQKDLVLTDRMPKESVRRRAKLSRRCTTDVVDVRERYSGPVPATEETQTEESLCSIREWTIRGVCQ